MTTTAVPAAPTMAELRALVPEPSGGGPRIAPGRRRDVGTFNWVIAAVAGRVAGTGPINIFTTLGRDRWVFRRWLIFAGALMPGGKLPRVDTELLILRVAANCGSGYEWHQHVQIGLQAGLSAERIAAIAAGSAAGGWTPRQAVLLDTADRVHHERTLDDEAWAALRAHVPESHLIEVLMLIGHYEMLATVLGSLRVPIEH